MGSSQVRRDNSGRVNLSIIPQSYRSSSMAGGGSISPSSLHDTTVCSTSSQSASPVKAAAPAETFGQVLSEDTIPVPRDKTSQNPLRSTPPPIPESLRLPTGLPEMEDFSADLVLSAEQFEEITRPPRRSSEAPTHHSEQQEFDEEVVESPDSESEGDSDWKPPTKKKGNQSKVQTATSTKSTSTRESVTSKVGQKRTAQDPKTATSTSTGNKRKKGKASGIYQPDGEPDENSQDALPLNAFVGNTESMLEQEEESSHIHMSRLSEKEKPTRKNAVRVPKKSFFDKQEIAKADTNKPSGKVVKSKDAQAEAPKKTSLKSVKTSRNSGTTKNSVSETGRPKANQGSSRTVTGAARKEPKVSGHAGNNKDKSCNLPVSSTKNEKAASALKATSSLAKTAPVAHPGSNQRKKRSPTYGSAKRPWRAAPTGGPEIDMDLTTEISSRAINTTSEKEAEVTQASAPSAQKEPRSARSRRIANLSIHSAGPSEIMSDPISDDIDASVPTSNKQSTGKKTLNASRTKHTKPNPNKCVEVMHKSPGPEMNDKIDVTMSLDIEPVYDDMIFSDNEAESSPTEAPSTVAQPALETNSAKDVFKDNDNDIPRPSEALPLNKVIYNTSSTQSNPIVNAIDSTLPGEEQPAMKKPSEERRQPVSSSGPLNRKRSLVSESGSPLESHKRSSLHMHSNFEGEESEPFFARLQTKPLPHHQPTPDLEQAHAPNHERHSNTISKAAIISDREEQPREVDATLLEHLVSSLRAEQPRINHLRSTTRPSTGPAEPVNLLGAERNTFTNQQPTMNNYQSTIAFINKMAAMGQETHLEHLHAPRQTELPQKELELQQDVWHPRIVASREQEILTGASRYKSLRDNGALPGPQVRDPTIRHDPNEWATWQHAVDDASEGVVDMLHNVTVGMLRHLRTKESVVAGVVDEYKNNGKRVANALVKKQDHERRNMAFEFHQQAMKFNQEFGNLASDDTMNDKGPARGKRLSRYDDWQKEVHETRNRIRELRSSARGGLTGDYVEEVKTIYK